MVVAAFFSVFGHASRQLQSPDETPLDPSQTLGLAGSPRATGVKEIVSSQTYHWSVCEKNGVFSKKSDIPFLR